MSAGGIKDQRVIITAGGSGIGRAIADLLIKNGAKVHICDIVDDFLEEFASSLNLLDELLLLEIYPARELPIEGVTSEAVLEKMSLENAQCVAKENVLTELQNREIEVLLTLGAGDIDRLVSPIEAYYGS